MSVDVFGFQKVKKFTVFQTELANISYFIPKISSDSSNQLIDFSKLNPTTPDSALQVEVGEINLKT